ncbi:MAG TPA: hypothetical protein VI479_09355 [Blastocatellia bacterium]
MEKKTSKMENELAALPRRAQVAFAAICAERALREGAKYTKHDVLNDARLRQALDFAWRYVEGEEVDYHAEMESTHIAIAKAIPNLDDPDAEETLMQIMSAVARTLLTFQDPPKAPAAASSTANSLLDLVALLYEDPQQAMNNEKAWLEKAINLLKQWGEKPLSRHMFDAIPEYERGPLFSFFTDSDN